jgi:small subunit ribosomal protein S3
MGQKVHPRSLRLGIIQGWDSTWMADAKHYPVYVKEDNDIRKLLRQRLKTASVSRIEIDRKAQKLILRVVTGRSGVVVGRGGAGINQLREDVKKKTGRSDVQIDVLEVARIDADAQLISESIAIQLEKRVAYRRAMKQAMQRAMRSGVKGIKVMVAGRLGGAEIARTEWAKEGRIPLHVFRADIDYGFSEAKTVFGIIGVKVWVFHREVLPGEQATANVKQKGPNPEEAGEQGNRRGGGGPGGDRGRQRRGRGAQNRAGKVTVSNIQPEGEGAAAPESTESSES